MAVILPQSIQSDVQSSLPILPDNGNPAGAYNMPSQAAQEPVQAPPDPLAWLRPSPYMTEVQKMLQQQDKRLEQMYASLLPTQQAMPSAVPASAPNVLPAGLPPLPETQWNGM